MFRCRLIRAVVNLSLIVVMMIQPGMALVFANDCGAKCASGFMCEGCCCAVASPDEKCVCCGGDVRVDEENSCCVGGQESNASIDGSPTDVEFTSTCRCGLESPPLGESSPAKPTIPTHESVAVRHCDLANLFSGSVFLNARCRDAGEVSSSPHFSQVQLCVWRL